MMNYSATPGVQGICPSGWHLPADNEWTTFLDFVSSQSEYFCNGDPDFIAKSLAATTNWSSSGYLCAVGINLSTNNATGFTGLPGGYRYSSGSFELTSEYGIWFSSSQDDNDASKAWGRNMNADGQRLYRDPWSKVKGMSVRCLMDETSTSQLTVTPDNQNVEATAGLTSFDVTSDVLCTVSEIVDWLTATIVPDGDLILVEYEANTTSDPRVGEITVTAPGGTPVVIVTVTQSGTPSTSFTCGQDFTDPRDGQVYPTVLIGYQCWMAKNMNIGTKINGILNQSNNAEIEKYCYDNIELNCNIYGGLYQWDEMMNYATFPGGKGICGTGWHVPTYNEYSALIQHLGGESVAGGKMKETGFIHWTAPNYGANNISGFTAIPAGKRNSSGSFFNIGTYGSFWTSTGDISNGFFSEVDYFSEGVFRNVYIKSGGLSIRCILD